MVNRQLLNLNIRWDVILGRIGKDIEELDKLETHWKLYYLYINNWDWKKVLFCELYDRKSGSRSISTRLKMSKSKIGIRRGAHSEQGKENIRKSLVGRIVSSETKNKMRAARMGKKDSQETIEKRKKLSKGKLRSQETKDKIFSTRNFKPIIQFNSKLEFIKEFNFINEASRELNISASFIVINLKGRSKTCKGFIFKYK